jgi:putative flippase GtrA
MEKKLIIKGHDKNIFVKFWNWGWGIYYKNPEVWNYLIVGLLTTVVSLVVYFALTRTILDASNSFDLQVANVISWIIAVLFAYVTNRIFVFKSTNSNILMEFIKFIGARILSLLLDMATMFIVVSLLSFSDVIGKILSQIIVIVVNYILSKLLVFKSSR